MKLFKTPGDNPLYQLNEFTEEELVALYNVALNYGPYIAEIMRLPEKELLKVTAGQDINIVRNNLSIQQKFCRDYVALWNNSINQGKKQE